jgi:hypothetical protein
MESLIETAFYNHYVVCWILDFSHWCLIGIVTLACSLFPIMLFRHIFELVNDD